jgi:hypothetical protein
VFYSIFISIYKSIALCTLGFLYTTVILVFYIKFENDYFVVLEFHYFQDSEHLYFSSDNKVKSCTTKIHNEFVLCESSLDFLLTLQSIYESKEML